MTLDEARKFMQSTTERRLSWLEFPGTGVDALIAWAEQRQKEEEHLVSASAQSSTAPARFFRNEGDGCPACGTHGHCRMTLAGWQCANCHARGKYWPKLAAKKSAPAWQPELPQSALIPDGWPNATPPRDASEIRDWLRTGKRETYQPHQSEDTATKPVSPALPPFAGYAKTTAVMGALATWEARK